MQAFGEKQTAEFNQKLEQLNQKIDKQAAEFNERFQQLEQKLTDLILKTEGGLKEIKG